MAAITVLLVSEAVVLAAMAEFKRPLSVRDVVVVRPLPLTFVVRDVARVVPETTTSLSLKTVVALPSVLSVLVELCVSVTTPDPFL
ncbi:hypothetical protein [Mesorhizobium sp. LNHC209A00]|uniref:hypothetical protein n=1 Tax=Mesorhizobium sp. LNHC209A00 TaxID=1287226 RepID=UPI0004CF2FA8|nr:hypothetical protein [Mesorhizobium sp. LNHC209A00]